MLQRLLFAALAVVFVIAVFLFTALLVALAASAGLVLAGWAWWRGRQVRRNGGRVIEGEYRIIARR